MFTNALQKVWIFMKKLQESNNDLSGIEHFQEPMQRLRAGHRILLEEQHGTDTAEIYDAFAESIKPSEFLPKQNLILEDQQNKYSFPEKNIFLPEDYEPNLYGLEQDGYTDLLLNEFNRQTEEQLDEELHEKITFDHEINAETEFNNNRELFSDMHGKRQASDAIESAILIAAENAAYKKNILADMHDSAHTGDFIEQGIENAYLNTQIDKELDEKKPVVYPPIKINMIKNGIPNIPQADAMDNELRDENGVVLPEQETLETKLDQETKKGFFKRHWGKLAIGAVALGALAYGASQMSCNNGVAPVAPTRTPTAAVKTYTPIPTSSPTSTPETTQEVKTAPRTAQLYMSNGMGLWGAAEKLEIEEERIVPFIKHHQKKFGLTGDMLRVTKNANGTGTWENCGDGLMDSIKEGAYEFDLNFDGKAPVQHYTGMTNTAKTPVPCAQEEIKTAYVPPTQTPTPAPVVASTPKDARAPILIPEAPQTPYVTIPEAEAPPIWIQEHDVKSDIQYVVGYPQDFPKAPPAKREPIDVPKTTRVAINEPAEQTPEPIEREVKEVIDYHLSDATSFIPEGPLAGWSLGTRVGVGDFNIARTFADGAEVDEAYGTNWMQIDFGYVDQNTNFKTLVAKTQGQEELGREYTWLPIAQPGLEIEGLAAAFEWEEKLFSTGKDHKGPFVSVLGGAQYTSAETQFNTGYGTQDTIHEQNNLEGKIGVGVGVGRFDDSYLRAAAVAVVQEITDETCGYCGIDSDSAIEATPRLEVDFQKVFKNKKGEASGVVRGGFDLGINKLIWTNDEHEIRDGWHGNFQLEAGKIWNTTGGNQLELGATFKVFGDYSDFQARPSALEDFEVTTHGKSIGAYLKWRF